MSAKIMLDTNVLVYAYDRSEERKQSIAFRLLDKLVATGAGVISTQLLAEFFVAVTSKIPLPLTLEQASERISHFCRLWPVLGVNEMVILEAIRGVREHRFSYWDAQIWATARLNQIEVVFSEDFTTDTIVDAVRFVNPFHAEFDWQNLR
jgi:predicted nucleic acid-binding protein